MLNCVFLGRSVSPVFRIFPDLSEVGDVVYRNRFIGFQVKVAGADAFAITHDHGALPC